MRCSLLPMRNPSNNRGGRPSKGSRRLMTTRLPIELADAIDAEAQLLDRTRSDYLAEHLAATHERLRSRDVSAGIEPPQTTPRTQPPPRPAQLRPEGVLSMAETDGVDVLHRLRAAVERSGLDSVEFGSALGVSVVRFREYLSDARTVPAHLLFRAERVASGLSAARAAGLTTAVDVSRRVAGQVRRAEVRQAIETCAVGWRDLEACHTRHIEALDAWEAIPPSTGQQDWDVIVAALVRQVFRSHDRQPPAWADRRARRLPRPRVLGSGWRSQEEIRATTPPWLSTLRVYLSTEDLGEGR